MATKRMYGFGDKGLGGLVRQVSNPDNPQDKHMEMTPLKDQDRMRVTLPKALVEQVRQRLINDNQLNPTQAKALSNNKALIYMMLQMVDNEQQRDVLLDVMDNQTDRPYHAIQKHRQAVKDNDKYAGVSDRQLLTNTLDQLHMLRTSEDNKYKHQNRNHDQVMVLLMGLLRFATWDSINIGGGLSIAMRDKIGKNENQAVLANLNQDNVLKYIDEIKQAGFDEYQRSLKKKRS